MSQNPGCKVKITAKFKCTECAFETPRIQALHGHMRFVHGVRDKPEEATEGDLIAGIGALTNLRLEILNAIKKYDDAKKALMSKISKCVNGKTVIFDFIEELKELDG